MVFKSSLYSILWVVVLGAMQANLFADQALKTSASSANLDQAVFNLFEAQCVSCHGSQLTKPKAKFGFIDDLDKLANDNTYIIPGRPEKSELYFRVRDNEMPPKKSKKGHLTEAQKKIVYDWIFAGAPVSSEVKAKRSDTAKKKEMSLIDKFKYYSGKQHPMLVHFPVAMTYGAFLALLIGLYKREEVWYQISRFCLWFAFFVGTGTVLTGLNLKDFSSFTGPRHDVVGRHQLLGLTTLALLFGAWLVIEAKYYCLRKHAKSLDTSSQNSPAAEQTHASKCQCKLKIAYIVLLTLATAVVSATGYFGAELTHGIGHLFN